LIPESFIQDLLARADVVDVVGRYVQLRKGGVNLLGLCPFHNEKTPSFTVSPTKQFYHCFGCGAHGTALTFLMEHTGASFPEAVRTLAASVGMTVPEDQPRSPHEQAAARQRKQEVSRQQQWLQEAQAHYAALLQASPQAQQYLKRRGLGPEVIERFGLGWSGVDSRGLARVFAHYDDPDLLESGLVIDGKDGRRYDRFRERIMFPIRNVKGHLIGFGGRIVGQGEPKYLNSPETPLFSKGMELYGLWEARQAIRREHCVLVVEGYMDVVGLAQHGIEHAVATLGTATTEHHIQRLLRASDRIVFSFDGDRAGRSAAWRALTVCLPLARDDVSIRFLFLPQGQDPDSYVREFGAQGFLEQCGAATPLSRFLLDELAARHPMHEAEGRAACVVQAQPLLAQLPQGALRLQLEREFAKQVQLTPEELAQTLAAQAQRQRPLDARQAAQRGQTHARGQATRRGAPAAAASPPFSPSLDASSSIPPLPASPDAAFSPANERRAPARNSHHSARAVTPLAKRLLRLLLVHPALVTGPDTPQRALQLELLAHAPHLRLVHVLVDVIRASGAQHAGAVLQAVQGAAHDADFTDVVRSLRVEAMHDEALPDPQAEWDDALRRVEWLSAKAEQTALVNAGLGDQESLDRYYALKARIAQLEPVSCQR